MTRRGVSISDRFPEGIRYHSHAWQIARRAEIMRQCVASGFARAVSGSCLNCGHWILDHPRVEEKA